MAIDREKARAAGYTDEEIDAYEAAQTQQPMGDEPPPPPPPSADQGQASGTTMGEVAATGALAAAPYVVPAVAAGGAALGGSKLYGAWKASADAARALADAKMASEQGIAQRAAARGLTPPMPTTPGPVAPTAVPSAPAAPAAPAQPTAMQRGMDYARQMQKIAADKVMQNAGTIGKAGIGAAAALTPGNIGQRYPFPTTGRFAGQEINPMTGRPWTPQELAQYR